MLRLTYERLELLGACDDGLFLFEYLFPNGAYVTRENLDRYYGEGYLDDLRWLAFTLNPKGFVETPLTGLERDYETLVEIILTAPLPSWAS